MHHGRPGREAAMRAGRHAKGSGVKARGPHAILEGAARAEVEEGGRQQVEAPCPRMEGRQSAED